MPKRSPRMQFIIEDAEVLYRNFTGKENEYNRKGRRNFHIILTDEQAKQLAEDGWAVKFPKPGEEDEKNPTIKITLGYSQEPYPSVITINSKDVRTPLDEETISTLDSVDIDRVDVICNSYNWDTPTGTGIAAYLKTMYVHLDEDFLQMKYAVKTPVELAEDDN